LRHLFLRHFGAQRSGKRFFVDQAARANREAHALLAILRIQSSFQYMQSTSSGEAGFIGGIKSFTHDREGRRGVNEASETSPCHKPSQTSAVSQKNGCQFF
jgi:hypothetical protein